MKTLRILLILTGLALTALAVKEWRAGHPPAWTIVAPTASAVVAVSEVRDEVAPDGKLRHFPHIEVTWPADGDALVFLGGIVRGRDLGRLITAESVVREHPVGSTIRVRVVGGQPLADHTDMAVIGYAASATLGALILLILGLFGFRGPTRQEKDMA